MIVARPNQLRSRGFTLLEVLLAVAVFAIVLIAINTVYFSALKLRNKMAGTFDIAVPLQHTVKVLKRDLGGIMYPAGPLSGQFQSSPTTNSSLDTLGQRVSPDIYTASAVVDETSQFSEVQKVAYFLGTPTNQSNGKDLIRSISRNLLPVTTDQPDSQVLMSGVDSMAFLFFNGTDWVNTWDSLTTSNLPTAIKVQIALAQADVSQPPLAPIEIVVPVLVQSRTNQTDQTTTGGGQ